MLFFERYEEYLRLCPIVGLTGYTRALGLSGHIFAYLDFAGPTGTAKDGLAHAMLAMAIEAGELSPGQTVLEADSGPFAAALTLAARRAGHPVTLILPDSVSDQRQAELKRLGARLELTAGVHGRDGTLRRAQTLMAQTGAYFIDHYGNDANPEYHRRVTGPAIMEAIDREGGSLVGAVVAGVGSGGTVTGVGEVIKAWTNDVRIVAVEPYECQVIAGGHPGRHHIPGLGVGFVPENYNPYVVDNLAAVSSPDALDAARLVLHTDGIPADAASGAALAAARQLLESGQCRAALCVFGGRVLV